MQKWHLDKDLVFKDLFDEATCLSSKLNITISVPRCALRQIKLSKLNIITSEQYYKAKYFTFSDTVHVFESF
ncbi:hypothetical protein Avbf_11079 [Armadillidium vulgare]|nr:hypothetical protein Avbf_11079 [Armadillidium vulgare]